MSITYQQAKRIRKTGLLSLFADQLMYEKKVTTAIGKTISLKTRGTMMGLGQYFDPLNIAKLLTFGSSLGPALLGHFTGRDVRDIQYFTGRLKPIHERPKTASKISKIPGGGGSDIESNMVLRKMYKLMSSSYESDLRRQELAKNREEENQLEDDERHKELLKALGGISGTTVVKITKQGEGVSLDKSLLDNVFGKLLALKTMMDAALGSLRKSVEEKLGKILKWTKFVLKKIVMQTVVGFTKVLGWIRPIMMLLRGPILVASLLGLAGYSIAKLYNEWGKTSEGLKQQIAAKDATINNLKVQLDSISPKLPGGQDNPEYMKKKNLYEKELGKKQSLVKELETVQNNPPKAEDPESNSIMKALENVKEFFGGEVKYDIPELDISSNIKIPPMVSNLTASKVNMPDMTKGLTDKNGVVKPNTEMPQFQNSTPNVVDNSKPTSKLNTVVTENQNRKLPKGMSKPAVTNNTSNVNTKTILPTPVKKPLPSVRNHEESFQRMIYDSTVVIG